MKERRCFFGRTSVATKKASFISEILFHRFLVVALKGMYFSCLTKNKRMRVIFESIKLERLQERKEKSGTFTFIPRLAGPETLRDIRGPHSSLLRSGTMQNVSFSFAGFRQKVVRYVSVGSGRANGQSWQ